jgi:hypothetical protein
MKVTYEVSSKSSKDSEIETTTYRVYAEARAEYDRLVAADPDMESTVFRCGDAAGRNPITGAQIALTSRIHL